MSEQIELTIDGKSLQVPKGTTVYQAAKQLGIEIPIFCYHDRMPPFGACRMCLVQVEKMGKLQTSCTLEATPGMVVTTQSGMAVEGRKEILELLLINHPLDCPICDRGGECPLQDNALRYGPGLSRFFEEKRHLKKADPLGPVLMLDQERCITCARCTRFGDELAGDHALTFKDRGYKTVVSTNENGTAQSKFIGNTIMICPVGALTSQVYRFQSRPWDNETAHSSCTLCPVGCSMKLDSRDGEIMRTRAQLNPAVNDIWLCDKGWFGYEFCTNEKRLTQPLMRERGHLVEVTWEKAIACIASKVKEVKESKKLAALGGNPLTTEENYLFQQLVRQGYEVNHLDHRVGMTIQEEGLASGMVDAIADLEKASSIVLVGLDLTEEFPLLWLRIRQALMKGANVTFIGHYAPEIAPHLTQVITHAPGKELEMLNTTPLKGILLVGRQYLALPNRNAILSKLMQFKECTVNVMEGRGNSRGARFAGMRPDFGPLGQKISAKGLDAQALMETICQEPWDLLHIAGSDPAAKFPYWKEVRKNLGFLVVQDLFLTKTAEEADLVLPARAFTEKKGSFINIEGRIQHIRPGRDLIENTWSDAEIFLMIAQKLGIHLVFEKEFQQALEQEKIPQEALKEATDHGESVTGDLLATFCYSLFDQGVRMQHNEHLKELVLFPDVRIHPTEGEKRKISNGERGKVNGLLTKVKWDSGVPPGTIVIPIGFKELNAYALSPNLMNGIAVTLVKSD